MFNLQYGIPSTTEVACTSALIATSQMFAEFGLSLNRLLDRSLFKLTRSSLKKRVSKRDGPVTKAAHFKDNYVILKVPWPRGENLLL